MIKLVYSIITFFVFVTFVGLQTLQAETLNTDAKSSSKNEVVTVADKKAETLTEDQIPLKIESSAKATDSQSQAGKLVLTLAVLVGMLGTAFYFIRKYSFSNKDSKSNLNIKVLTQHHLGPKKTLAVVRVAGESILIGVTDHNISMIKSLSLIDDEIPLESGPEHFAQALNGQHQAPVAHEMNSDLIEDDFSFSGIKTSVTQKLKSMRNFQ